jgi:NADH-quinone oxidoreductase subunit L
MGGLRDRMPVTFWTFVVYTLAISGVPLTSGFLSKDEILAGTLAFAGQSGHVLIPIVGFLVAGLTAFYMFRLVILTFLGTHADGSRIGQVHESPKVMTVPLLVLAALSVFVVFSINPLGAADSWVVQALPRPESVVPAAAAAPGPAAFAEEVHHVHLTAMLLSLGMAGLGILAAFGVYRWGWISADAVALRLRPLHRFLVNKWYFDDLYDGVVVGGTHLLTRVLRWFDDTVIDGIVNATGWLTRVSSTVSGWFDNYVVDGFVNGSAWVSGFSGLVLRKFQSGRVQTYALFAVAGMMLLYFVFRII